MKELFRQIANDDIRHYLNQGNVGFQDRSKGSGLALEYGGDIIYFHGCDPEFSLKTFNYFPTLNKYASNDLVLVRGGLGLTHVGRDLYEPTRTSEGRDFVIPSEDYQKAKGLLDEKNQGRIDGLASVAAGHLFEQGTTPEFLLAEFEKAVEEWAS